jgi:hypothetical protein
MVSLILTILAYFNVTNPAIASAGTKAFSYMKSSLNKTFQMTAERELLVGGYGGLKFSTR